MKWIVGYRVMNSNKLVDALIEYKNSIHEVYFSWGNFESGRGSQLQKEDLLPWQAEQKQQQDLKKINNAGIPFNLLFNGNCYGAKSQSRSFFKQVGDTVDFIKNEYNLKSVTTTSYLVAKFLKNNFSSLDVRASVNLQIGTVEGIEMSSSYFDSYYIKREHNRDFSAIEKIKKFTEQNGKAIYLLANSGCFNHCPAQTFHDNLVSHEQEIKFMDNAYQFEGLCYELLNQETEKKNILYRTNFIRPEDIEPYNKYFTATKLAMRSSNNPIRILKAYENANYSGSILDLLEPNHSGKLYPFLIENRLLPKDFLQKSLDKSLCSEMFKKALINIGEDYLC